MAVALPRSAEAVIATLATLVAGASYVPIDPNHPERRRRRLAERAGAVTVVESLDEVIPGREAPDPKERSAVASEDGAAGPAGLDDEAYLLFTSGSTGEPKGVPITHRGLARYLEFARAHYVTEGGAPVVPLFSALAFDLTVTSLYLPLLAGGELVVIREEGTAGLRAIAERPELTWVKATPSHLELLVRLLNPGHGLRTLVVGGEAFPARLARRLTEALPGVRLFNEYGPTEAVVGCMIHEAGDDHPDEVDVPIGRPAPGVTLAVLDRYGQPVPEGCPGELHIASEGVTAGYLDDPADDPADDERTGVDGRAAGPFSVVDGVRWYRSGDLAAPCGRAHAHLPGPGRRAAQGGRRPPRSQRGGRRADHVPDDSAGGRAPVAAPTDTARPALRPLRASVQRARRPLRRRRGVRHLP